MAAVTGSSPESRSGARIFSTCVRVMSPASTPRSGIDALVMSAVFARLDDAA